ncbi:hypothetical protein [Halosegnis longus]|uniref:hypothetical protein n=1 Tax=Halosegnis longus TaxID=2216012 RepID=UPI00129D2DE5|nr:hypothetical protein [Halosegnis longus]
MVSRILIIAAAVLATALLLPALVAGGGFVLAAVLAALVVAVLLGSSLAWDLILNREMGAKGRRTEDRVRDLVGSDGNDRGRD